MKYNRLYMAALISLAMGLAGCSADDSTVIPDGDTQPGQMAVSFTTRGTTGNSIAFAKEDRVNLIAGTTGPDASTNNIFTYDGEKWDKTYIVPASFPVSLTAVCPAKEGVTATSFSLPNMQGAIADQGDASKLKEADYMTSEEHTVTQASEEPTQLNFSLDHRLCRLTFTITEYGNEFGATLPEVTNVIIKSQGRTVSFADSWKGTGDAADITPLITPDTTDKKQHKYEAIVAPCALTSGSTLMMALNVNGKTLNVKYTGKLTALESGTAYHFDLTVGKNVVTITSATDFPYGSGWGTEDTEL